MAASMRNTSTSADDLLLDAIAAAHAARMCPKSSPPEDGDFRLRREPLRIPVSVPSQAEPVRSSSFASVGEFAVEAEPPRAATIPVNAAAAPPAEFVSVSSVAETAYRPAAQPEISLAEEILRQQMEEENEGEGFAAASAAAERTETAEQPLVVGRERGSHAPSEEEEDVEMPTIGLPSVSASVRPRVVLGAIRPPAQPNRLRSLLVQGIIVLLSLTAAAMFAYVMGILRL